MQIVSDTQWRSLTSSDFATYKAIVVGDPNITPRKDQNLKQDGALRNLDVEAGRAEL